MANKDLVIPQRNSATTFAHVTVPGGTSLNRALGFDGSGILGPLAGTLSLGPDTAAGRINIPCTENVVGSHYFIYGGTIDNTRVGADPVKDQVLGIGWNMDRANVAEPRWGYQLEHNWQALGSTVDLCEWYLTFGDTTHSDIRPGMCTIDRLAYDITWNWKGAHTWYPSTPGSSTVVMQLDTNSNVGIGPTNPAANTRLRVHGRNVAASVLFAGDTGGQAVRIGHSTTDSTIEGFDITGGASYKPLNIGGESLFVQIAGTKRAVFEITTGKFGYASSTGTGGTVTQLTSKSTGVTLDKLTGLVILHNAELAAGASVSFTLTNSTIHANDEIAIWLADNATADTYSIQVTAVATGSCRIQVHNFSATPRSEALYIGFSVRRTARD